MKNLLIEFSYDGSCFKGYQRLNEGLTVQGYLETYLSKLLKEPILVNGSGRTDKGVHALGQVATFNYSGPIPVENLLKLIKSKLHSCIEVHMIREVSQDFHARYSAIKKVYVYKIEKINQDYVFRKNYAYCISETLNIEEMQLAANHLIGQHDFTSFVANRGFEESKVRIIDEISITKEMDTILIEFVAKGFMYKMIRLMTGHLIEVGQGKFTSKDTKIILESKSREVTKFIAPASGLYLKKVGY